MNHRWVRASLPIVLFLAGGCGASGGADYPAESGRRVQGVSMVAGAAVPYRVDAYELVFAPGPGAARHVRRAALLVDLAGGHGQARGFLEWGRPDETPQIYVVGGWARQRASAGDLQTVFELSLDRFAVRAGGDAGRDAAAAPPAPLAVRVVVHEGSGDVTLLRRR